MYVVTVKNFSAFVLAILNNIQKCYAIYIGFERICLLESLQSLRTTKNTSSQETICNITRIQLYKEKCSSNLEQKRLYYFCYMLFD
jgi:hypothetical protein